MTSERKYKMTVDPNVLIHLAEGLYRSVAAVITEAIANAWDAGRDRSGYRTGNCGRSHRHRES